MAVHAGALAACHFPVAAEGEAEGGREVTEEVREEVREGGGGGDGGGSREGREGVGWLMERVENNK